MMMMMMMMIIYKELDSGGPGAPGAAVPRPVGQDGSPGLGNVIHQIVVMVTPVNLKNVTVDLVAVVQVSIHCQVILKAFEWKYRNIHLEGINNPNKRIHLFKVCG